MVAIVSGNSLGLNLTSKGVLGGRGIYGNPTTGQGGEQVYVNASTGNLVMQQLQDQLVGVGLDATSVLTYNSLGQTGGNSFTLGKAELSLSGSVNTSGSTIVRTAFDGSQSLYMWDATHGRYIAVNGTGAFDTISFDGSSYHWTDGSSRVTETYNGSNGGILSRSDASGNTIRFGYAGRQISTITDANGEVVTVAYDANNQLASISAPVTNPTTYATTTQQIVSYSYDSSNRLASVTVDLSPDGSTADGNVYVTSFTYDGTSSNIHTMQQTDGTKLTFLYDTSNRVSSITDALSNVTSFTYDTGNRRTSVTANGQTTVYGYDATTGLLASVTAPQVNGASAVSQYTYNANGELSTFVDGDGRVTSYGYDASGNQVSVLDGAGNLTTRTYDALNRLLTETTSTLSRPALVTTGSMAVSGSVITKTGASTDWDASARSANSIAGPCTVTFAAGSASTHAMVGLNSDPDTNASYTSIDYAIYMNAGTIYVMKDGSGVVTRGSYAQGDVLGVSYDGAGHVNFLKNGAVIYSLAATVSQPLYVDSSFSDPGSSVSNLRFGAGAVIDQTLINGNGMAILQGVNATKSAPTNAWDSSVYGTTAATSVSFNATSTSDALMIGLNRDPATDSTQSSLDFAVYLASGQLQAYANGAFVAVIGNYVSGDALTVAYDGVGHINFTQNGHALYTIAATVTQPLYLDSSFGSQYASVANLTYTPATTGIQPSFSSNGMSLAAETSVAKASGTTGWDASVYSASGLTGPVAVSFNAGSTSDSLMVGLNNDPTTDSTQASLDYAVYLAQGQLQAYANGAFVNVIGSYAQGDALSVSYDGAGHVDFIQNGKRLYTIAANVMQPLSLYLDSSFGTANSGVTNLTLTGGQSPDQTTRYVYSEDGKGLLRFVISPAGRVKEYGYDAAGEVISENDYPSTFYASTAAVPTEAQMVSWRTAQDLTRTQRTEYTRDTAGQVTTTRVFGTTASNGTGVVDATAQVTSTVRDKRGDLLKQQDGSPVTTLTVDGLGRVTSRTESLVGTTTTSYADASSTITISYANGLVRTETLDKAGRVLTSVDTLAGATQASVAYTYDAAGHLLRGTDASGASTWSLYDADGRKDADIDALGVMTEYVHDNAGLVTRTIRYSTPISAASLVDANGIPNNPSVTSVRPTAGAADHSSWTVYDTDGHVIQSIDSMGSVTQYEYDGSGQLISTREYATPINTSSLTSTPAAVSVATSSSDRLTRNYYDADGLLTGTLDADNCLTEYQYDGAGRRTVTIRYATATTPTSLMTLPQARPAASSADARGVTLYDLEGRVAGQVDPGGSLTAMYYNADGTVDYTTVYATRVSLPVVAGASLSSIVPAASGQDRTTSYTYDADARVHTQTDPAGTVTTYTYDAGTSNVVSTSVTSAPAGGGTTQTRYDASGRVVATLDGVGSAAIASGASSTAAAWAQYGTTYTYDLAGRRASMTDAKGNRTLYFYDSDGQLRYTVDPLNDVKELRYDAFGNATTTISYAAPIDSTGIGAGGPVTATLTSAVNAIANAARDSAARNVYDADGRVTLAVDPSGSATTYSYDALGNVTQARQYANAVPSGSALQVNFLSPTDFATQTYLGTFNAGDVVTATVCFKAPAGSSGMLYLGNFTSDQVTTQQVSAGGWVTLSITHTMSATSGMFIDLYADNATHASVNYDNLRVASASRGVVTDQAFDTFPVGIGIGQWRFAECGQLTSTSLADAGTDAQLQALVNGLADNARDRTTTHEYDADGRLVWSADVLGHATRTVYDSAGRPVYVIAADGAVTRNDYDADGRVASSTTFANPLGAASLASLPHSASAPQVASLIVPKPGSDAVTRYQYDALGQMRFAMDGTGAVSEKRYDQDGNVVDSITYATKIDPSTWSASVPPTVVADAAHDRHVHASYDALGRVVARSDGTGAVVVNTYDADGRLTDRISYANRIAAGSWLSGQTPAATPDSARDIHERFAYDALGQLAYSADGTGAVTAYVHDANGNMIQKTAMATPVTLSQPLNTVSASAADRTERFSYDAFGRQAWHADAAGALDYTAYDASGRVTQVIRYAQTQVGSLPAGASPLATGSGDRLTRSYYDAFGQATYVVDPLGRVTANSYDQVGRLSSTTRYANALLAGLMPSAATIPRDSANDQTTAFLYDNAGRVRQRTDAMGGVQSFVYDGLGNKLTLVDENGRAWSWTYDTDGRELTQTSPAVSVTTNAVVGTDLADSTVSANVVTSLSYDGTGNLTQRVEGYGRSDARTTVYGYDAAGRQISVQAPAVNSYDNQGALVSSSSPISRTCYDAFGNVVATVDPSQAINYTSYDQANRVVYTVNALGYVIGNVRDAFGDISTLTKYGAQSSLVGSVPASAADAPTTASIASSVGRLSHDADRVTTYAYDAAGRVKSQAGMSGYFFDATAGFASNAVETNASPLTNYWYDAFGDVVLQEDRVNQTLPLYAQTFRYYDQGGQQTDTVDAMGFQTHRSFDAFGNVTQTTEYATAKTGSWSMASLGSTPATSASDRSTSDVHDRLNRKTSETRTLDYSASDDGVITGHSVTSSWGYDAQGRVTSITDASGAISYKGYDALGRLRAVISPARSSTVDGSTATPVTEYSYDAFGDASVVTERFNSATNVQVAAGAVSYGVTASASDRTTRTLYDGGGHAVQVDDPMAATTSFHNTINRYDANGRLVYTFHNVGDNAGTAVASVVYQGTLYDAAGQAVRSISSAGTGSTPHAVTSEMAYDAFGELVTRGVRDAQGNPATQEFFRYDNNGNLWLTNTGTGVATAYAYNLQGRRTMQYTGQGYGHGDVDISTATSIQSVAAQAASLRAVNTVYDFAGNQRRIDEASRKSVDAGLNVRVGATSWSITKSGVTNSLSLAFNPLNALGTGQVQFTVNYVATDGTASVVTLVADSAQATSSYIATWTPTAHPGVASVTSVAIAKKDVDGSWHTVNTSTTSGVSHTQLEIDAPDDPRSIVTFTYALQPSGSATTLTSPSTVGGAFTGLINYGNAYSFDTSTLAAGTYSYSITITTPDGAVSTSRMSTFTVGSNQAATAQTNLVTPSILQTFDRWGNVLSATDPRSAAWVTSYQYNGDNQVVMMTQPAPLNGGAALVTQYFYDRQGHRVATIDADSHLHGQLFDAAGQIVETDGHPDSSTLVKTTNAYDVFGQLVQSVAGDGYTGTGNAVANIADYTTRNTYDALGELLFVQHGTGSGNVTDIVNSNLTVVNERQGYTYDSDGHRLSSWDDTTATHLVTSYGYDAAGNLISTTLPLISGQTTAAKTTYAYDDFGHEVSQTDANGKTETWTSDYFGRVTAHKDFGTTTYNYSYDHAGQLYRQTSSAGQDLNYGFDAAGQQTSLYDAALNETTAYTYDAAGRHLQESTSVNGAYYQDNHLAYDNVGRLIDSSDGEIHVSFQYDGVGNRTFIGTHVIESGALLSTGATSPPDSTRYFTYDGMNRQLHVNWQSATTQGQSGHTLTYDADGNRLSDVFMNNLVTIAGTASTSGTAPDGSPIYTFFTNQSYSAVNALVTELYTYDADDRLTKTLYSLKSSSGGVTTNGWIQIDGRSYDSAGRLKTKAATLPRSSSSSGGTTLLQWLNSIDSSTGLVGLHLDSDKATSFSYDEDGELATESAGSMSVGQYAVSYTYDAAGNNNGNTLTTAYRDASGLKHTSTTADTSTLQAADGSYLVTAKTSVQSTWQETETGSVSGTPVTINTSSNYDVNGHVASANAQFGVTYNYVDDAQGNALSRSGSLRNLVVNGEALGQYGVDGSVANADDVQTFRFTFGFQSMEDASLQTGTGVITASQGETLQQVAAASYGDASLWRRIAAINGLGGHARLQAGQRIIVAGNSGVMFNSASTFAISDPSSMVASIAARTVANDPSLTANEQDDYYKDVYGRARPVWGSWKGGGDGGAMITGAVAASSSTDYVGSGADMQSEVNTEASADLPNAAQTSFQQSEHASANGAQAISQTMLATNLSTGDLIAAGFSASNMQMLGGLQIFGNAAGGSQQYGAFGSSAPTSDVFVDGDRSGLRYAAPAPGSSYPDVSSPMQDGGDQAAKSDPNWGDYTQLAAGPGYSGLGQSRQQALDTLRARQEAGLWEPQPGETTDDALARVAANRAAVLAVQALPPQDSQLNVGQSWATFNPYARGLGDVRDTSPIPVTQLDPSAVAADVMATLPGPIAGGGEGVTAGSLVTNFVEGAAHGAVDIAWQPVAQVLDLGQVVVGLATGGAYEPHWFSGIGQNSAAGMGAGETFTRAVLGSNPVTGVGLSAFDMTGSVLRGDWNGVARGVGGLAGGFAAGKAGQRYLAPTPGTPSAPGNIGTTSIAETAAARQAAWGADLNQISSTTVRLGQRALRQSGGNPQLAEKLFESYLGGVSNRLSRTGSDFGIDIQPASLPGAERVPNFIYLHRGGENSPLITGAGGAPRLFAYPGSRRLDAGVTDLGASPNEYGLQPVVAGFDITVSASKPKIVRYYQEYFGNIPIYDIRLNQGPQ